MTISRATPMPLDKHVTVLDEPPIECGYSQHVQDPRNGLALFGPYDREHASRPGNISYGVIGTAEGIERFHRFSETLASPIVPDPARRQLRLWRPYPGFDTAFGANWPTEAAWTYEVDGTKLEALAYEGDRYRRAFEACGLYLKGLQIARQKDEHFGLFFCIIPKVVYQNCRPQSKVEKKNRTGWKPSKEELQLREGGQGSLLPEGSPGGYSPEMYQYSVDFRRQLKARALEYGFPLQLVRESTLRPTDEPGGFGGKRGLSPHSDRAWNLTTTAYYKAGGKPWRLASAREGVCYVGLAFKRTETETDDRTACCAAQMFLDTGDGVVFKGQEGPWYSPDDHAYHLEPDAARHLLAGVLKRYRELEGKELKEIFLHSRSTIGPAEFEGYRSAAPDGVKVVGIRVQQERGTGVKLYRDGDYPVLRGTFWVHSDRTAFLWGSGFIPSVATYPGPETPLPLRIDIQRGDEKIGQVARDILGLTKLNYNACRMWKNMPITVGFSDKVGEILIANRAIDDARPQFKYYI